MEERMATNDELLEQTEDYEPPRIEDVPAQDGPAVTAAGYAGDDKDDADDDVDN
jgi:hypothetical protein